MFRTLRLATALGALLVLVAASVVASIPAGEQPKNTAAGSTCHDGTWDEAEFCGRDAWVTTGETEMNHDCVVDIVDAQLFSHDVNKTAPALSGDFNGDGTVNVFDLAFLGTSLGDSVPGCTRSGMRPDTTQGSIALSFSPDPSNIEPFVFLLQGATDTVYVVIDGYGSRLGGVEYTIETSPNLPIRDAWQIWLPQQGMGFANVDLDSLHSYRATMFGDPDTIPVFPGPVIVGGAAVEHTDGLPAWIRFVETPVPLPPFHVGYLRWMSAEGDRSYFFESVQAAAAEDPTGIDEVETAGDGAGSLIRLVRPNPFRGGTSIRLQLVRATPIDLRVYDVQGRPVRALARGTRAAGTHEFVWAGEDAGGGRASAGVYFVRVETPTRIEMHKVVMLK